MLPLSWSGNVDLFEKDFIFVPINEALHWSLVVIWSVPTSLLHPDREETPLHRLTRQREWCLAASYVAQLAQAGSR